MIYKKCFVFFINTSVLSKTGVYLDRFESWLEFYNKYRTLDY